MTLMGWGWFGLRTMLVAAWLAPMRFRASSVTTPRTELTSWAELMRVAIVGKMLELPRPLLLRLFSPLALGDVHEQDRDSPLPRFADPKGGDIEPPAIECLGLIHETHRLAGHGHLAVDLEPVGVMGRGKFSHPLSQGVLDPVCSSKAGFRARNR